MGDRHTYFLRRSGSMTSLASMASTAGDRRHGTRDAHGAIKLDLRFEKPKPKEKTEGTLHIMVKEGLGFVIHEPYVKLYLSKDGKDIRGTKQKTKPHKKQGRPLFEERFVYYLKKGTAFDTNNRLQLTVWDHARLGANECVGGFSFGLDELTKQENVFGWWQLLPEADGRTTNEFLGKQDTLRPEELVRSSSLARHPSQTSLASTASSTATSASGSSPKHSSKLRIKNVFRGRKGKTSGGDAGAKGKADAPKGGRDSQPQQVGTNLDVDEDDFEKTARSFSRFAQPVPIRSQDSDDTSTSAKTSAESKGTRSPNKPREQGKSSDGTATGKSSDDKNASSTRDNSLTAATPPATATSTPSTAMSSPAQQTELSRDLGQGGGDNKSRSGNSGSSGSLSRSRNASSKRRQIPQPPGASAASRGAGQGTTQPKPTADNRDDQKQQVRQNAGECGAAEAKRGDGENRLAMAGKRGPGDSKQQEARRVLVPDCMREGDDSDEEEIDVDAPVDNDVDANTNGVAGGAATAAVAATAPAAKGTKEPATTTTSGSADKDKKETGAAAATAAKEEAFASAGSTQEASAAAVKAKGMKGEKQEEQEQEKRASKESTNNKAREKNKQSEEKQEATPKQSTRGGGENGESGGLQRSDSLTSLVSLRPDQIVSSGVVRGTVWLSITPAPSKRGRRRQLEMDVQDSRALIASRPYLKVYVSKGGSDIKKTKWKSAAGGSGSHKLPTSKTTVELPDSAEQHPASHRLQIAVWDRARYRSNECTGSFSFSISDLLKSGGASGWYRLLPYHTGRTTHVREDDAEDEAGQDRVSVNGEQATQGATTPTAMPPAKPAKSGNKRQTDAAGGGLDKKEGDSSSPITTTSTSKEGAGVPQIGIVPLSGPGTGTASATPKKASAAATSSARQGQHQQQEEQNTTRQQQQEQQQQKQQQRPKQQQQQQQQQSAVTSGSTLGSGLRRAGSLTSLVSVASTNVVSAATVQGELSLNLHYEPWSAVASPTGSTLGGPGGDGGGKRSGAKGRKKNQVAGHVHMTVSEGRDLAGKDTYVKLYLSQRGKNVRTSKHKTAVQRRTKDPVYQESFKIPIGHSVPLDDESRLQITVWDHSRMRHNECLGAMSFSLLEIASTTIIAGWFRLLPHEQGRAAHAAGTASARASSHGRSDSASVASGASGASSNSTAKLSRQQQQQAASASAGHTAKTHLGSTALSVSKGSGAGGGTGAALSSSTASGGKKRKPLFGGGSKALQKQVDELKQQVATSEANEQRHVAEKALLEEKLQRLREDRQREVEDLQQQVSDLSGPSGSSRSLLQEKEELEVENGRLHKMLDLMQADAREHRDEISSLRDRVGDLMTEIQGLRAWKTALVDEMLRLDPKAFTRASLAIADSMNE